MKNSLPANQDQGAILREKYLSKGYAYFKGNQFPRALSAWQKSARLGSIRAAFNVGTFFHNGREGVAQNHKRAAYWYRKAIKNQHGPDKGIAIFNLGFLFFAGEGVPKNSKKGMKCFHEAVGYGVVSAALKLGYIYRDADEGVSQDLNRAAYFFGMAARWGSVEAQSRFAYCYQKGEGVKKNLKHARSWYKKAAERGDSYGQNEYGYTFVAGWGGIPVDLIEASKWFNRSAQKGYPPAMNNFGICFRDGNGVEKNLETAAQWFRKAAEAGWWRGQWNLYLCYTNGDGVPQDDAEAEKWFELAKPEMLKRGVLEQCLDICLPLDPPSGWEPKTPLRGRLVLQRQLAFNYADVGKFVMAFLHRDDPVWRFRTPNGGYWNNGLPNCTTFRESFEVYDTKEDVRVPRGVDWEKAQFHEIAVVDHTVFLLKGEVVDNWQVK